MHVCTVSKQLTQHHSAEHSQKTLTTAYHHSANESAANHTANIFNCTMLRHPSSTHYSTINHQLTHFVVHRVLLDYTISPHCLGSIPSGHYTHLSVLCVCVLCVCVLCVLCVCVQSVFCRFNKEILLQQHNTVYDLLLLTVSENNHSNDKKKSTEMREWLVQEEAEGYYI